MPRLIAPPLIALLLATSTACLHRRARPSVSSGYPTPPPASHPETIPSPGVAPVPTPPPTLPPAPAPIIQGEEGIASWYGYPFHGRQAASGETYNMYDMTAAHKTLPFGTQVRVHDLANGKDVVVRVNDRGPFVDGRIIDLSYAAAMAMGMTGIAPVRLEILDLGSPGVLGIYAVQVGAFRDLNNAERLRALIAARYGPVIIQSFDRGDGIFHRVRVGHETTEDAAQELARVLREQGLASDTFVVRLN